MNNEPRLAKPGAGLPFIEWAIAKFVIIPARFKNVTAKTAISEFVEEAKKIQTLTESLSEKELGERRLIPRLQGLEDSSRYWSCGMTLQHLNIVNSGMMHIITLLSKGNNEIKPSSTAAVKPSSDVDLSKIRAEYESVSQAVVQAVSDLDLEQFPRVKYAHPWFGPLNAREWLLFAAPHQKIHRKQIVEIIKRF